MVTLQRIDELTAPPRTGSLYLVPAVRSPDAFRTLFGDWMPILEPVHKDPGIPGGEQQHLHVDFRFCPLMARFGLKLAQGKQPLTAFVMPWPGGAIEYRPMVCWAASHEPWNVEGLSGYEWQSQLETEFAEARVSDCQRCPHQGVSLGGVPLKGGLRECPAHGLRWGADGRLKPRGKLTTTI